MATKIEPGPEEYRALGYIPEHAFNNVHAGSCPHCGNSLKDGILPVQPVFDIATAASFIPCTEQVLRQRVDQYRHYMGLPIIMKYSVEGFRWRRKKRMLRAAEIAFLRNAI